MNRLAKELIRIAGLFDNDYSYYKPYSYGRRKNLSWKEVLECARADIAYADSLADEGKWDIGGREQELVWRYVGQHSYDHGDIWEYKNSDAESYGGKVKVPTVGEYLRNHGLRIPKRVFAMVGGRLASLSGKVQRGVQRFFMEHGMQTGETYDEFMEELKKNGGRPEDFAEEICDEIDPDYNIEDLTLEMVEKAIGKYFESGEAKKYWME